ncbi:efflux RND transporter periplasmic adaptor subunit [Aliiglaciecola lipolytica]|uniref:Cu(I)/Ag(I) efflux system membrane protein CusB n=1 Tax=Aliiglaciecola lipolytica E3 TaxID=1127673 RepID=K6XML1_9ALTE|nr:efflux RND transporter periplasmic adaptor subunit [Aliiglaciecola lipolytica]GAC12906.1 Cu(I)/Ag(I) efflux system membrane protein CusB [Aliiglaciecola lipolytica E3]
MNQTPNEITASSKPKLKYALLIILSVLCGSALTLLVLKFAGDSHQTSMSEKTNEAEPLYWVAPMDPNFRRDQPGKSPMGMDLVPVFAEDAGSSNTNGPGTVSIAPNIVNNLGVRTAEASYSNLHVPIHTVGYVGYNEDNLVHIHARAQGWIDKLYVKSSGEQVANDQPLYALYSPELVNAQEEYLLAVNRGNKGLTNAALARLVALQMPKQAIDKLKETKTVQQTVEFRSPQAGVVDNLSIREGFFVNPERTLMSVASLDDIWVETEVFERHAAQVKVGLPVSMTLDYLPGEEWHGEVDYIYPTLNAQTRTLRARLRFPNSNQTLKPNMFAQVTIHTNLAENSLLVPSEAVIRTREQDRVVLALGDGKFKSVAVKLGAVVSGQAQILSGLEAGDKIVISAQFLLDSESSIDSDFMRMDNVDSHSMQAMPEPEVQSATVMGKVNEVKHDSRQLNISRGPIEKWGRGPATLDFDVLDTIDLSTLSAGSQVHFTFEIRAGEFVIVELMQHGQSQMNDSAQDESSNTDSHQGMQHD